jgi:hypothetical protein
VLRPDLVGWRRERVPDFPRERPIPHRPDWVCEILSPTTAARDRGPKRDVYRSAGVPRYWLLDVANRTITVLRLDQRRVRGPSNRGRRGKRAPRTLRGGSARSRRGVSSAVALIYYPRKSARHARISEGGRAASEASEGRGGTERPHAAAGRAKV